MLKCVIYKKGSHVSAGLFSESDNIPGEIISIVSMEENREVNALLMLSPNVRGALSKLTNDIVYTCLNHDSVTKLAPIKVSGRE